MRPCGLCSCRQAESPALRSRLGQSIPRDQYPETSINESCKTWPKNIPKILGSSFFGQRQGNVSKLFPEL